jgi:hypothetical protein
MKTDHKTKAISFLSKDYKKNQEAMDFVLSTGNLSQDLLQQQPQRSNIIDKTIWDHTPTSSEPIAIVQNANLSEDEFGQSSDQVNTIMFLGLEKSFERDEIQLDKKFKFVKNDRKLSQDLVENVGNFGDLRDQNQINTVSFLGLDDSDDVGHSLPISRNNHSITSVKSFKSPIMDDPFEQDGDFYVNDLSSNV